MQIKKKIKGNFVYLQSLRGVHATSRYLAWLEAKKVNNFLEMRFNPPQGLLQLKEFISNCNNSENTLLVGIFENLTKKHVGNIKLDKINSYHKTAEIGFLIGETSVWGKGYASEAIKLFSEFAFTNMNIYKITAGCYANNIGSRKALLKSGFKIEGRLKSQWNIEKKRIDGLIFGKISK